MDYKKILKGIVNIINTAEKSDIGFVNICNYIGENCPELKESEESEESEDEEMRNFLINFVKINEGINLPPDDAKKALAWLEKQKDMEAKLIISDEGYNKAFQDGIEEVLTNPHKYGLEKQGENSVCKVKIGETYKCIASPRYTCFRRGDTYQVKDNFVAELINTCSGYFVLLKKQGKNNMGISEATKQELEDNLNNALEKETPESWNEFLEKQGEQHNKVQVGEKYKCIKSPVYTCFMKNVIYEVKSSFVASLIDICSDCFELVTEEKTPADKVEPKFKVGDWVVYDHRTYQVVELPKEGYINLGLRRNGKIEFVPSTYCKHWTIQDAKAGDVLCCENGWTCIFKTLVNDETFSSYCFMDNTKWFCETGSECHTLKDEFVKAYNGKIYPATKEQRDTLIKAMTDAGWEFDFDKKELKKIEQSPAWSEDDQSNFNELSSFIFETYRTEDASRLITWLEYLKDRVQPQPKQEWSEEDDRMYNRIVSFIPQHLTAESYTACINWLKSLRPQNTWKPSDEQMDALRYVTNFDYGGHKATLVSLYEQLKKLREE